MLKEKQCGPVKNAAAANKKIARRGSGDSHPVCSKGALRLSDRPAKNNTVKGLTLRHRVSHGTFIWRKRFSVLHLSQHFIYKYTKIL